MILKRHVLSDKLNIASDIVYVSTELEQENRSRQSGQFTIKNTGRQEQTPETEKMSSE